MQCYLPLGQEAGISGITLLARPRQRVGRAIAVLRRTLAALAPGARFIDVAPLQDLVDGQIRPWRLGAAMFGLFGALALLVAALGLLPAALSTGVGSDTQKPFALVIVGGLFSRLLISVFLMPVLYAMSARPDDHLEV